MCPNCSDGEQYHPDLEGVVVYGGLGGDDGHYDYLDDTWLWDGTEWTELYPGQSADARVSFAMAYDASTGKMMLQGGSFDENDGNRQTWELALGEPLRLRWRFCSDLRKSDADFLDTDGGAWIDNVTIKNAYQAFIDGFETGLADPTLWSFPDHDGVLDGWHMEHDPDPPYEGGEGTVSGCDMDSSVVFRARPEGGFPTGVPWQNEWFYTLATPAIPIQNTGCVVQYDRYFNLADYTCDFANTRVRFYDASKGTWCPWIDPNGCINTGYTLDWLIDETEDLTMLYGLAEDSLQFAWDFMDLSRDGEFCRGKHTYSDHQVDNISIGFFDGSATRFATRPTDLLHDTFQTGLCGYNSYFRGYNEDTVAYYAGGVAPPRQKQLNVDVIDRDGLSQIELVGSIDGGGNWITKPMALDTEYDPDHPGWGGTYYGTFCPADFSLAEWEGGTDIWYYVRATDELASVEYFPALAAPTHPAHSGLVDDYFDYSILPGYPPGYSEPKVLLVAGAADKVYDVAPCTGSGAVKTLLTDIYDEVLDDAGYPHDKYDVMGTGGGARIQPTDFSDYDVVIWFGATGGPAYSNECPLDALPQNAIRDYLSAGGKVVICGDRFAYLMYTEPCDSLSGEFFAGVLGAEYLGEMQSPFDLPTVQCSAVSSVDVFGVPTAVNLDDLTVYRWCPEFRSMDCIRAATPPPGYTAQPLLEATDPFIGAIDMGIYVEKDAIGQCTFLDFDLIGTGYCGPSGFVRGGDVGFAWQDGRTALLRMVLEDIYGLPPSQSGVNHRPPPPSPGPSCGNWGRARLIPSGGPPRSPIASPRRRTYG
jgi:hypothetical protein